MLFALCNYEEEQDLKQNQYLKILMVEKIFSFNKQKSSYNILKQIL